MMKEKGVTIFWDFATQTDRKIRSNRTYIVFKDYKRKILIWMASSFFYH